MGDKSRPAKPMSPVAAPESSEEARVTGLRRMRILATLLLVAMTALFIRLGALQAWPGWAALAITIVSWLGLARCYGSARGAERAVEEALAKAPGDDYAERILPAVREQLMLFMREPSEARWDNIHSIIIDGRAMITVWQAVCHVDHTFPSRGPSYDSEGVRVTDWPRVPSPFTVARAIREIIELNRQ